MKSLIKKKVSLLLTALMLIMSILPATVYADVTTVNYLALGDSLAAGQTPYRQLGKGYADLLAEKIYSNGYLVVFDKSYAVSGYTTSNVLSDIQSNKDGIIDSIAKANVLTLDIGANDILHKMQVDMGTGTVQYDLQDIFTATQTLLANLNEILTIIKSTNPNVKIYLMGYYNPLPFLPEDTQTKIVSLIANLNELLKQVSLPMGVTFIPTQDPIAQNAKVYIPNPTDIHPGAEGYQVIANEFWNVMQTEFPVSNTCTIWEEEKVDVPLEKEWTIKFNTAIKPETLNNNIDIINGRSNNNLNVDITPGDNNTAIVTPLENYVSGEIYYLLINKDIQSQLGKLLDKPIIMKFTVETGSNANSNNSLYDNSSTGRIQF